MRQHAAAAVAVCGAWLVGAWLLLPPGAGTHAVERRTETAGPVSGETAEQSEQRAARSLVSLPTAIKGSDAPAVDVDLVPGGLWLTYPDARVEFVAVSYGGSGGEPTITTPEEVTAAVALSDGETAVELLAAPTGWWVVTSLGRVIAAGGGAHHGDMGGVVLNEPVVDAAATATGEGYLMLAADGGVFAFGDAVFRGSVQGIVDDVLGIGQLAADHLTAPIVTLGTSPEGYWLVAADGAVFPFGDAPYLGSFQDIVNTDNKLAGVTRHWSITPPVADGKPMARDQLDAPVISLVPSAGHDGYMMLASDGGIFTYGNTRFLGSFAHRGLGAAVAIDVAPDGSGYVVLTSDGNTHLVGAPLTPAAAPAVTQDVTQDVTSDVNARSSSRTATRTGTRTGSSTGNRASAGTARPQPAAGHPTTMRTTTTTAPPPPAANANACRPVGPGGFPPAGLADLSDGTLDVLVVFAEFDDAPHDDTLWPWATMNDAVGGLETFLMTQSYGHLDATFTVVDRWVSLGPSSASFLASDGSRFNLDQIAARAVSAADAELTVSVDGDAFDGVLVVLPPARYGPLRSSDAPATVPLSDDGSSPTAGIDFAMLANGDARAPREPIDLDDLLRDVVADTLGLGRAPIGGPAPGSPDPGSPDPSSPDSSGPTPGNPELVYRLGRFGFVGIEGWWPVSPSAGVPFTGVARPGRGDAIEGAQIRVDHTTDLTDTFLGWSRWKLGWLAATEVECVTVGTTSFNLAPLAVDDPDGDTTLAVVPLSDRQLLVLESRRWAGDDADIPTSGTDGPFSWNWQRRFEKEGVLAYLVDPTIANASGPHPPYALLGSDATGLLTDTPFVGVHESFTLTGENGGPTLTVAVTGDDGTNFTLKVDLTAATNVEPSYTFAVTRVAAPTVEALVGRSCRPAGPEGFPVNQPVDLSDNTLDVLVVFAEFGDARHDETHLKWSEALDYLRHTEDYLEAQSYGTLDVNFELAKADGWITLADTYDELTLPWSDTSLDIVKVTWTAATKAKAEGVDFVGRASQFDSIAVLLPPSHFRGASAFNVEVPTDDQPIQTPLSNGLVRLTSAGDPTIRTAARVGTRLRSPVMPQADYYKWSLSHELAHNLGLNDLYAYGTERRQVPDPSPRQDFLHGVFGRMSVHGFWPVPVNERGGFRNTDAHLANGDVTQDALVYTNEIAELDEMLGWSRLRLGWLTDDDIECVEAGTSTIELDALADSDGDTRLAVVPLGGKQLLVLEARRWMGYDADTPRTFSDGQSGYNRELPSEGVFVYLVNPTIGNGQVPIAVLGHTGRECAPQSPILRLNETVALTGSTLTGSTSTGGDIGLTLVVTIEGDDGTSFRVNIDYQDASTPANSFDLEVARTPVVDLDAAGCRSEPIG